MSDKPKEISPRDFSSDIDATHLIRGAAKGRKGKSLVKVSVAPQEQLRVPLGSFTAASPAKGFSIELDPDPSPEGSIVTHITNLGTTQKYRLILHIANFGNKAVTARVERL